MKRNIQLKTTPEEENTLSTLANIGDLTNIKGSQLGAFYP